MDKLKKFTFDKRVILVVLVLALAILQPPLYFSYSARFAFMLPVYEWGQCVCFLSSLVAYLLFGKKDLFPLLVVLLMATCCLSSYFNSSSFISDLYTWIPILTIVLVVATASANHLRELLTAVCVVSTALCVINLLSMIVYPDGMYETPTMFKRDCFFWGHRNGGYTISIPAIISSLCIDSLRGRRISGRSVSIFVLALAMSVAKFSATSFLAIFLLGICVAAAQIRALRKWINGFTFLGAYIVLFLGIVVFRLQLLFEPIFQMLGRNASFTGRTVIWDYVISMISDPSHIVLGYGQQFTSFFQPTGQAIGSAHNTILHIVLLGGLIALAVFSAICIFASCRLFKNRFDLAVAYISIGFGAILLIGMTENTATKLVFFLIVSLAYYTSEAFRDA